MSRVFLLSLLAAFNPTLVAATTVMLLLPNPRRLMLGYLAGAMMTSITLGVVIVYALKDAGAVNTTKRTLSPSVDIALGALAIVLALVLRSSRVLERREHRRTAREAKGPPRWQRTLSRGTPRTTFVIGALLTLPGASYLAGLHKIDTLHYAVPATVLLVIAFNIVMLALLEVPLLSFTIAPDWTPKALETIKSWVARNGRRLAIRGLVIIGALLIIKGIVGLIKG
jgi:Sap, sulfolipid-1-addressing protein